ncbi:beta strand repeat-containing protein [Luteolibacter sp. Populi]|uniref:beta strand repeat-containing protein n=1 Tax=Luteolibacter sp. Populi TaxID=3230487 RepID=UPI00346606E9
MKSKYTFVRVRISRRYSPLAVMSIALAFSLSGHRAKAASGSWTLNNNGDWATAANWQGNIIADGSGSTATFDIDITADRTISVNSLRTIGNLTFRDTATASHAYIIGGNNLLNLDDGANKPTFTINPRAANVIIARIDRAINTSNGFEIVAPNGPASMALGNIANSFGGSVQIKSGASLRLDNAGSLGNKDLQTTATTGPGEPTVVDFTEVEAGGTLNVNGLNIGTEYIKVAGTGWDGAGAIVNTGAGQTQVFQQMELTGNVTFGGANRWDVRGGGATARLFQNGFTITKTGTGQVSLVGTTIVGGGDIIINQGSFGVETGSFFDGTGTVTVNTGGTFLLYENNNTMTRALNLNGGNFTHGSGGTAAYGGDITLSAPTNAINPGGTLNLNGAVNGSGALNKTSTGTLALNGAIGFTGATNIAGGTLRLGTLPLLSADITMASGAVLDASLLAAPQNVSNLLRFGRENGGTGADVMGSVTIGAGADVEIAQSVRNGAIASQTLATVTGNLSFAGGGTIVMDVDGETGFLGDALSAEGDLSFAGSTEVQVTPTTGGYFPGSLPLISWLGTLTGSSANLTLSGLPASTRQSFALSTTTIPNTVSLDVTGSAAFLEWVGNGTTNTWDLNSTAAFSNGGPASAFMNLDTVNFTSGSAVPPINLSGTLIPGTVNVDSAQNFTFAGTGIISGASKLVKTNTGTLTISGTGHDFFGPVTINGGILSVPMIGMLGQPSALGTGNNILIDGGTLSLSGPSETTNKTLSVGTSGGTLDIATAGTVLSLGAAAPINSLGGDLTVSGPGALRFFQNDANLTVAANFAGTGTVRLNPHAAVGSTGLREVILNGNSPNFAGTFILESPVSGSWRIAAASGIPSRLGTADIVIESGAQLWPNGAAAILTNDVTITGNGFVEDASLSTLGAIRIDGNGAISNSIITVKGASKIGSSSTGLLSGVTLRGATSGGGDDILTITGSNFGFAENITFTGTVDAATLDKIIVGGGGTSAVAKAFQIGDGTLAGDLGGVPLQLGTNAQPSVLRFHQPPGEYVMPAITVMGTGAEIHANMGTTLPADRGLVIGTGHTLDLALLSVGSGGGTAAAVSKLTVEAGATIVARQYNLGDMASRAGVVDQTGGDITVNTGGMRIGHFVTNSSVYNMSGGTLTLTAAPTATPSGTGEQVGGIYVGVDGTGSFIQSGGAVSTKFVVLDNRVDTAGVDTVSLNGGTLALTSTWGMIQRNATTAVNFGGGTVIAGANLPLDVAPVLTTATVSTINTSGFTVTAPRAFTGGGALTVNGGGTFSIGGVSSFNGAFSLTGNTTLTGGGTAGGSTVTVDAGSTVRPTGTMGFAGGLTLQAGSTLDIPVTGAAAAGRVNVTGALATNGTIKVTLSGYTPAGGEVYNIADFASRSGTPTFDFSAAALAGGLTWNTSNFAVDGTIQVVGGNAYASFESANGITGAGANADSDMDGIQNGIEFVLGGDPSPPASNSNALLPTLTVSPTHLNFVFRRTDASVGSNPQVQYGSNLGGWTVAANGQPGATPVIITVENDFHGAGTDRVTVQIPRALALPGTKLFARLIVTP